MFTEIQFKYYKWKNGAKEYKSGKRLLCYKETDGPV